MLKAHSERYGLNSAPPLGICRTICELGQASGDLEAVRTDKKVQDFFRGEFDEPRVQTRTRNAKPKAKTLEK